MPTRTLPISPANRPWATGSLSCFQGSFAQDSESGLYFDASTPANHIARIRAAFACAPPELGQQALKMQLTVSTAQGRTRGGHRYCTIYGDWSKKLVSPHLEISQNSLDTELFPAHLVHELSHLLWYAADESERLRYSQDLKTSHTHSTIDVTAYAQEKCDQWLQACALSQHDQLQAARLRSWASESFAESAAVCAVPHYLWDQSTVAMTERKEMIRNTFKLEIEAIARQKLAALPSL